MKGPPPDALPHTWFAVDRVPGDAATTAWKRRARAHQAVWRTARGYPVGTHPHGDPEGTPVGSRLELGFAQQSTSNFLTPGALAAVRHRLAHPEKHEMLQATRLWADLLSSMPLCFNLFGDLAADAVLARRVVDTWWPEAPSGDITVRFEHSPGRFDRTLLGNRSAFDVMLEIALADERRGIIGMETKYHEHAQRERPPSGVVLARYLAIAERSGAFTEGWQSAVVGTDLQQIWLDHLLLLSMLQHPSRRWSWGRFIVLTPKANPSIVSAITRYRALLRDDATFGWLSLEEALGARSPLGEDARAALVQRYLPQAEAKQA